MERRGKIDKDKGAVMLAIREGGTLDDRLKEIASALAKRQSGDNTQTLTAIKNLTELVKENFMGLKEDFETLKGKFDGLESATTAVADDIAALKAEIAEANDRANIDLTPLMTRAENIEAGLRAAAGSQAGSDPTAPPVEEPPAGGGEGEGGNPTS